MGTWSKFMGSGQNSRGQNSWGVLFISVAILEKLAPMRSILYNLDVPTKDYTYRGSQEYSPQEHSLPLNVHNV